MAGATTATLLEEPQRRGWRRFPPQVTGLPGDADLVTVTAGGNDLGYIGTMTTRAWGTRLADLPLVGGLVRSRLPQALPVATAEQTAAAEDGLVRVVDAVRRWAPGGAPAPQGSGLRPSPVRR